jgi:hypothetical protein
LKRQQALLAAAQQPAYLKEGWNDDTIVAVTTETAQTTVAATDASKNVPMIAVPNLLR